RQAYVLLSERVRKQGFASNDVIVVLQPMLAGMAEIIFGVTTEAPVWPFLVAGLGGISTELLDAVALLPISIVRSRIPPPPPPGCSARGQACDSHRRRRA